MTKFNDLKVAFASGVSAYPSRPPFHPPELYPEYKWGEQTDAENEVYAAVRRSFWLLELDRENFGTDRWNPLGEIIRPGQRVLLKPNFVLHRNLGDGPVEAVITHGSVLRAIADYVLIALKGSGELVIGDSPQMNCDWETLLQENGVGELAVFLEALCRRQGIKFSLVDFRSEQTVFLKQVVWKRVPLRSVADRTVRVNVGVNSAMEGIDIERLYGADYARHITRQAHSGDKHEYLVSKDVLSSDVIISVPKLKVHCKVGTTLNLKNMVGINTDKNHLAHYRVGSPSDGGDEFCDERWDNKLDRKLVDLLLSRTWSIGKYPYLFWRMIRRAWRLVHPVSGAVVAGGSWHGNDTAWRMTLDLNRVVLCADQNGVLHDRPMRTYFSVIDGIIAGQGDGPLYPDEFRAGTIVAGFNPVATDWAATQAMGFSPARIKLYSNAIAQMKSWITGFGPEHIRFIADRPEWSSALQSGGSVFAFAPAPGWVGAIEQPELKCEKATG